jgi:hypothetical protein
MTPAEFEEHFRKLVSVHANSAANTGCLACTRSERCSDSTFLEDCNRVVRSNYCKRCTDCTECSHCVGCTSCMSCSHCEACERCTQCAYLVRSVACNGCTYCFGCVGLVRKDFHILNEPYDRQAYFAKVAELRRALRI